MNTSGVVSALFISFVALTVMFNRGMNNRSIARLTAAVAILLLIAVGVMVWPDAQLAQHTQAAAPQIPARFIREPDTSGSGASGHPPASVARAPATAPGIDPFSAFVEAARNNPVVPAAGQVSVPDEEPASTPDAFKEGLEAGKRPDPLPIVSPFGRAK